jgi:hypothetical protein
MERSQEGMHTGGFIETTETNVLSSSMVHLWGRSIDVVNLTIKEKSVGQEKRGPPVNQNTFTRYIQTNLRIHS